MTDDRPPTEAERRALAALEAAARPAAYAQIGGFRPDPSDHLASWWGGNFAGLPGVAAPINRATGALLSPLVQIRLDTAPVRPPCLEDTALLSFWIDWTAFTSDNPQQGVHFDVLWSPTLDNLEPLGPGYRERHALPCLPIRWRESGLEAPHWGDFPTPIPPDAGWFFDHELRKGGAERRDGRPLKLGGWPDYKTRLGRTVPTSCCKSIQLKKAGSFSATTVRFISSVTARPGSPAATAFEQAEHPRHA